VDVAGADADAALLVLRHVDGASGGQPVSLGQELEDGPGAVEGAGLGGPRHRQAFARAEFVPLLAERGPLRRDIDNDVSRTRSPADDGDAAVARRAQVVGEGVGDSALGPAVRDQACAAPVDVLS
jgi:hypothetical protein